MSNLQVTLFRNFPVYSVLINLQLTLFRKVSRLLCADKLEADAVQEDVQCTVC
jgi:hypothetical protein